MQTIQRDIVGAFIISADNKILLGNNRKGGVYGGMWVVPGGGVEPGESKEQAMIREVSEEVTLDVSNAKITLVNATSQDKKEKTNETGDKALVEMSFTDFLVELTDTSDNIPVKAGDDFENLRWVKLSDLPNTTISPPMKATLMKLGLM